MKRKILLCLITALLLSGLGGWLTAAAAEAKWPEGSSAGQEVDGKLKVDKTNTSEGYFMAAVASPTAKKLKLRVVYNDTTLYYELNGEGKFEVIPLQLGSGQYKITLMENVNGKNYSNAGNIGLDVNLSSETIPFLYPNQFVNYDRLTQAVADAEKLCAGKGEKEAYTIIKKYMTENFGYDYIRAATEKPGGALPDIKTTYDKKKGICQDLAAIMVCMLRTQGIPSKLMFGYADKNYHAWVVTIIEDKQVMFDPSAAVNGISKPSKYSLERFY